MGTVYGYIRVSSVDQNEDRQLIALRERGIPLSAFRCQVEIYEKARLLQRARFTGMCTFL